MAKAMIKKRRKPPRKKSGGPDMRERLRKLTADAPVARFRGGRYVLESDGADKEN